MNNSTDSSDKTLEAIALNVLKEYGIAPESLSLIQGGTIKTVWKLQAQGRLLCLKRLKQTYDKALFSVNAQIHIKNSSGKVPGVILNRDKQPIVLYNEQLFVLYEWINGNDLNFDIAADLRLAVQGLAGFHITSRGYCPDDHARISSKLGKWPEQYESMKNKLVAWKETADRNRSQPHYLTYSQYADSMIHIANQALDRIGKSNYKALTEEGSPSIVLCHQDYGRGNVVAAVNGVFVLDLDGVTFDLPARDLRKIIGKNAENRGQWQTGAIKEIIDWYIEINPQNNDEIEVLYVDLTFPHWFYGLVKNLFQNGKPLKASEIERIAKLEETKIPLIKTLLKRSE